MTEEEKKLIHLQNVITRALNKEGFKQVNYLHGEGIEAKLNGKTVLIKITVKG